eukprot:7847556-Alexandrium_andersonii.AAC.1
MGSRGQECTRGNEHPTPSLPPSPSPSAHVSHPEPAAEWDRLERERERARGWKEKQHPGLGPHDEAHTPAPATSHPDDDRGSALSERHTTRPPTG